MGLDARGEPYAQAVPDADPGCGSAFGTFRVSPLHWECLSQPLSSMQGGGLFQEIPSSPRAGPRPASGRSSYPSLTSIFPGPQLMPSSAACPLMVVGCFGQSLPGTEEGVGAGTGSVVGSPPTPRAQRTRLRRCTGPRFLARPSGTRAVSIAATSFACVLRDAPALVLIATQSSYRLVENKEVRPWLVSRSATWTTR